jgi:autotransporter passenger strand-loop-strand repeat protein
MPGPSAGFFSIDGGQTYLNQFTDTQYTSGYDFADWAAPSDPTVVSPFGQPDAFGNNPGTAVSFSDVAVLDVLGYHAQALGYYPDNTLFLQPGQSVDNLEVANGGYLTVLAGASTASTLLESGGVEAVYGTARSSTTWELRMSDQAARTSVLSSIAAAAKLSVHSLAAAPRSAPRSTPTAFW